MRSDRRLKRTTTGLREKHFLPSWRPRQGIDQPAKQWIAKNLSNISSSPGPDLIPAIHARFVGGLLQGNDDELDQLVREFLERANENQ